MSPNCYDDFRFLKRVQKCTPLQSENGVAWNTGCSLCQRCSRLEEALDLGAMGCALATHTAWANPITVWSVHSRRCSARGRAEQQLSRLRSPFISTASLAQTIPVPGAQPR